MESNRSCIRGARNLFAIFRRIGAMEHIVRISAKDNALSKRDQSLNGKILAQVFRRSLTWFREGAIVSRKRGRSERSTTPATRKANNLKFAAGKFRTLVIELGALILV